MLIRFFLFIVFCGYISFSSAFAKPQISWTLENNFRLFLDPQHTKLHQDVYGILTEQEKQKPILSIERRLSERFPRGWAEPMYKATCWNARRNSYQGCSGKRKDFLFPEAHKIIAQLQGVSDASQKCIWRLYKTKARKNVIKEQSLPCTADVTFDIPYPGGGWLSVSRQGQNIASSKIKVRDLFIIGLGDSFASGEGNPDVPVIFSENRALDYGQARRRKLKGYPAREGNWRNLVDLRFGRTRSKWQSIPCHRSLYSHQLRVALQLALENKRRAVTFVGFACSGAESIIGVLDIYKGNEWVKYLPRYSQVSDAAITMCREGEVEEKTYGTTFTINGQIPTLENLYLARCPRDKHRKIDLLLLSVGGNDVGFSRLIANAILNDKAILAKLGGWVGRVHSKNNARQLVEQLKLRYKALNRAFHTVLHIPWKEADRVILTAYPHIGYSEDGKTICPDGTDGMDLHPIFKVDSKKVRGGEKFGELLEGAMRQSAARYKWSFVTGHRQDFAFHGYCAVNVNNPDKFAEDFSIPRKKNDEWRPYGPREFKPYASRQRWIWTPNDVFMIANHHPNKSIVRKLFNRKKLRGFQLIYAGTYGGAFHPTAEGQAVIADYAVKKARAILQKYR